MSAPGAAAPVVELAEIHDRIAVELDGLARLAEEIQGVAGALAGSASVPDDTFRRLQQLDLLTQSLDDLARATRLAAKTAPAATIDIAEIATAVRLQDLRSRLLAVSGGETAGAAPGVVSMF